MAGGIYEQRQERLLELLLEAGDRPLSLQALEAAGVASPATVIYELELAGYPIERVEERLPTGGRRLAGFRLRPNQERREETLDRLRSLVGSSALGRRTGREGTRSTRP